MESEARIDKWLWAVRIFKTRSQASEACKKGQVLIANFAVKPSRLIRAGDVVNVRKAPIVKSFKVLDVSEKRMSAKLAENFVGDITSPEQLEILEIQKNMSWVGREKGTGRPTKKERRELDDFKNL
jgi:ribosome-associated heat shock protein Hsp15